MAFTWRKPRLPNHRCTLCRTPTFGWLPNARPMLPCFAGASAYADAENSVAAAKASRRIFCDITCPKVEVHGVLVEAWTPSPGTCCSLRARFFSRSGLPGPSLMVVLRNTMLGGRRQGVMCALGHGLGFGIYAGLAVYGLIVLLEEAPQSSPPCKSSVAPFWFGTDGPCGMLTIARFLTMTTLRVHKASLKASPLLFSIQKLLCFWWRCWPKFSNPT